tara:strand:- start:22312 stop:22488 length:177 start_codon:yes stop_codon:yes gene_type:complete
MYIDIAWLAASVLADAESAKARKARRPTPDTDDLLDVNWCPMCEQWHTPNEHRGISHE